jgi:endothelin-converting enzyme/putative endopeptidase
MSEETKTGPPEAGVHLNKIGYPDEWRDYRSPRIARGEFFENVRRAEAFESARILAKIGRPVDRGEWFMSPPTVNAYYNPQLNDINFPAGILQPPYFDPAMDDAVNYGAAGAVIGHELTHGFDDEGRQFDGRGNLEDWWTPEDERKFQERARCVEQQYSSYIAVGDIAVNGKLTLGENVADLGGTRLAYSALKARLGGRNPEPIDGFTAEQRFFLAFGQGWCMNSTDEFMRLLVQTDPHAPNKLRVNGVLTDLPEFASSSRARRGS